MFHSSWKDRGLEAPSQLCEGNDTTFPCCRTSSLVQICQVVFTTDGSSRANHARKWIYTIRRNGILHDPPCGFILGLETSLIRPLKSSWCGSWKHLEKWLVDVESQTVHWLLKWVHALPHCVPTCDELEQFTGVHTGTPEQHKDIQQSTRSRDNKERSIFVGWLQAHHHLLDTKLIAWSPCQLAYRRWLIC